MAGTYTYDAFGNLTNTPPAAIANNYEFSTKEFDPRNGLYYFGARYYDPEVGRWLTPDSLGLIDGVNLYAYVNNNPLNLIDPFGFMGERRQWWDKLEDGYYYGTGFGEEAVSYYAMKWAQTDDLHWGVAGGIASVWTPATYKSTLGVIIYGGIRAVDLAKVTYWQYYPAGVVNYISRYFTSSKTGQPPHGLGGEAQEKLRLPAYNSGTAVKQIKVNPFKYIKGSKKVPSANGHPGGGTQDLFQ